MARFFDKPGTPRPGDVMLRRIGPLSRQTPPAAQPTEWAAPEEEPILADAESAVPLWQRPFKPLPNVRYTRSPDPTPRDAAEAAPEVVAPIPHEERITLTTPVTQDEPPAPAAVRYTRSPDLLALKKSRSDRQSVPMAFTITPAPLAEAPVARPALTGSYLPDSAYWETVAALGLPDTENEPPAPARVEASAEPQPGAGPINDNRRQTSPQPAAPVTFDLQAPSMAMLAAQMLQAHQASAAPMVKPAPVPRRAAPTPVKAPPAPVQTDDAALEAQAGNDDALNVTAAFEPLVYDTRRNHAGHADEEFSSHQVDDADAVEEDDEDEDDVVEALTLAPARPAPAPVAPSPVRMAPAPVRSAPVTPVYNAVYELPPLELLAEPPASDGPNFTPEGLEQNARLLEGILEDFGIRGEIIDVKPGPVVTLYELEPAAGIKSSRVIGLADDIARSMSALSARVAVIPGRNVIGIELPNVKRETVYFRELIATDEFQDSKFKLALSLGKTIGGEAVIAQLEKMPHLLVAGTTGSGKSVAINTMILSLLYRLKPEECRLIMVDPKMLELSIYDGIPHLLCPVVTDPKKAVLSLKWAVREMEERYKKMSKMGVRNIDGYNSRAATARETGETFALQVQTGFDKSTGRPIYEMQDMDLSPMPYIVVIVDEMADLMMVAGKDIEGAIQRLAQMARAAGIHLIMATQRPSVDVITGTIKANFPTRISFQVTSKIDSRTILGEQGAEQLLGQGDMLHMVGGGRIARVHGPFVSDAEVEKVVRHLKAQGQPDYLDAITAEDEPAEDGGDEDGGDSAVFDQTAIGAEDGVDRDLYEQAVKVVLRDKKCSTSYIQRRLQIGYNKAASLVERMEKEGMVGAANHAGKREILVYSRDLAKTFGGNRDEDEL